MEQYSVFILALKESVTVYTPLKMALIMMAVMFVYRLSEIIKALREWRQ